MAHLLEALNGAALLPVFLSLLFLGFYLSRESRRRGLGALNWFHLPPSMNLVFAMFVFNLGIAIRLATTFLWYLIGEKLAPLQFLFLVAIVLIIMGALCKIKALTDPEYGRGPWLAAILGTGVLLALLLFR